VQLRQLPSHGLIFGVCASDVPRQLYWLAVRDSERADTLLFVLVPHGGCAHQGRGRRGHHRAPKQLCQRRLHPVLAPILQSRDDRGVVVRHGRWRHVLRLQRLLQQRVHRPSHVSVPRQSRQHTHVGRFDLRRRRRRQLCAPYRPPFRELSGPICVTGAACRQLRARRGAVPAECRRCDRESEQDLGGQVHARILRHQDQSRQLPRHVRLGRVARVHDVAKHVHGHQVHAKPDHEPLPQ
uniref:Uncharacterized protein n=1 Tax=Globisporangium ultimum (strain ATCC 200006 / CBS 805.95 / DAOM BR144) TaxID=431595 RepID=K3WKD8_GLOUD